VTDAAREFRAWDDGSGTVAGSGLGPCARRLRWFVDADLVGLACVVDVVVVGSFGSGLGVPSLCGGAGWGLVVDVGIGGVGDGVCWG